MQYYAGTQSSASTAVAVEPDHHGDGRADVGEHDLHAFTSILQNGVQIALIK